MSGFDLRDQYFEDDLEDENGNIITDEDPLDINFDDDVIDEEELVPQKEKQENRKHTVFLILAISVVVFIASVVLGGYMWYRSVKAPQIVSVHIESDNFENPEIAKYGNMITLSFSFDTKLSNTPKAIINNKNVEVYGEGKEFYAKYFVQVQTQEEIHVEFSIHDYRNELKKTGQPITTTTDGSSVIIPAYK